MPDRPRPRTLHRLPIAVVALTALLHGCASDTASSSRSGMADVRQILESLGVDADVCVEDGSLATIYGNTLSRNFQREYERERGCAGDVYWYEFVHAEKGRGYAWSTDLDRINNGIRRLHETDELRRVISGPNFYSDTEHEGNLPSYLDAMYRPGAHPPSAGSVRYDVESVTDTIWDGIDNLDRLIAFRFFADGRVHVYSESGVSENASWQQDGSTVFIEINDRYVEHYGSIDGDTMTGNAWNATGARWTWTAERRSASDESGS